MTDDELESPPGTNPDIDPLAQARKFIRGLGDVASSFTGAVRSLYAGGKSMPNSKFSFMTQQNLKPLLRSPSVLSHLYYAALAYHKNELLAMEKFTPVQLAEVFNPIELAALLTVVYFHRRLMARCDKKEWANLSIQMQAYLDLAVPLGQTIPAIGPTRAILTAGARYVAWGSIATQDIKGFKKYKVAMKVKNRLCDLIEEQDLWGTSHAHIGAVMFQLFGFGINISSGYLNGQLAKDPTKLDGENKRFRVAQLWLDALIQERNVPHESIGDDYVLSDDQVEPFVELVQRLVDEGSEHAWLSKRRDDIGPKKTPALQFDYERFSRVLKKGKPTKEEDAIDEEMEDEEAPKE